MKSYSFELENHLNGVRIKFDHEDVERILKANGYTNLRLLDEHSTYECWVCDGPPGEFLNMTCVMRDILHVRLMGLLTQ